VEPELSAELDFWIEALEESRLKELEYKESKDVPEPEEADESHGVRVVVCVPQMGWPTHAPPTAHDFSTAAFLSKVAAARIVGWAAHVVENVPQATRYLAQPVTASAVVTFANAAKSVAAAAGPVAVLHAASELATRAAKITNLYAICDEWRNV